MIEAMERYTIGQLARAAGVASSTVRYYERRGLVRPVGRSGGNYRVFDGESLARLLFVRSAQGAGFTLSDIGSLLELKDGSGVACSEVQALIGERLGKVGEQMEHLREVDGALREWLGVCKEVEGTGECGVISGLGGLGSGKKKKIGKE